LIFLRGIKVRAAHGGDASQRKGIPKNGAEAAEGTGWPKQETAEGEVDCSEEPVRVH